MRYVLLLLVLVLAGGVGAGASDLRGRAGGLLPPVGSALREPTMRLGLTRRAEVLEARRDADRALRQARLERLADRVRASALRAPPSVPYARDIRGEDRVLGTAKAFVRINGLLGRAEAALQRRDRATARRLAAMTRTQIGQLRDFPADEPMLVGNRARLWHLEDRLARLD